MTTKDKMDYKILKINSTLKPHQEIAVASCAKTIWAREGWCVKGKNGGTPLSPILPPYRVEIWLDGFEMALWWTRS